MLAILAGAFVHRAPPDLAVVPACTPAYRSAGDVSDYGQQWRQIADEFYAAHPVDGGLVDESKPAVAVIAASRRKTGVAPVAAASQRVPRENGCSPLLLTKTPAASHAPPPMLWRLHAGAASMASGILAFLLYRTIWPTLIAAPRRAVECSHALRLELPSEWLQFRPTFHQQLRRVVLVSSCLISALAIWTMVA